MAKPTLTQDEKDAVEAEKSKQESTAQTFTNQQTVIQEEADELGKIDNSYKKFFSYYNDDIIGKYDAEKKALEGVFQANPIVEQDIVDAANRDTSGRLTPEPPTVDIIRIAEFDGGNTTTTAINEEQHITDQAAVEDALVNGYVVAGTFDPTTASTTTSLDASSTSLTIEDLTNPIDLQVGDVLAVEGATEASLVEIISDPGDGTTGSFTYGIEIVTPPAGTIAAGASIAIFSGFTNTERDTKTASEAIYQQVIDELIVNLETEINNRKSRLSEELTALNNNDDPDASTEINNAITNVNDSDSFLQNYLDNGTDISDTGLGNLSTERSSRSTEITNRLSEITDAYTLQTENYYDQRYTYANNRAHQRRGALTQKILKEESKSGAQNFADEAQESANQLDSML